MTLLANGETPSMADVAKAADVSRRTVYMHFPTIDQLLLDATAGALSRQAIPATPAARGATDDVEGRVASLARSVQRMSPDLERLGRSLIRLTVEPGGSGREAGAPLRGYPRVAWIEEALAPLRSRLDARRFERLVSALAMVIGWEAMIVQRDVRGLSPDEGEELSVWAARALVRATLDEARSARTRR